LPLTVMAKNPAQ